VGDAVALGNSYGCAGRRNPALRSAPGGGVHASTSAALGAALRDLASSRFLAWMPGVAGR